jgi:hypothetical protein
MMDNLKNIAGKNKGLILTALIVLIALSYITFSLDLLQQDDYFHIKYSQVMRSEGIKKQMPSMKYTIMNENFYDQHMLYHVFLIPFTFGDMITGAKIALLVLVILSTIAFYKFLEYFKIKYPGFWTLAYIFGSPYFLSRLISLRPITLAVILFVLGLYLLFEKKYKWLALLSFLFVYTYSTFPMFILIVLAYTAVYAFYFEKLNYKPLMYTIAGTLAGLIINPYFPRNISFLAAQYGRALAGGSAGVNLEFTSVIVWDMLKNFSLVFLLLFIVTLIAFRKEEKLNFKSIFLFITAAMFFGVFAKMQRGADQFIPFAILFAAFAFTKLKVSISSAAKAIAAVILAVFIITSTSTALRELAIVDIVDHRDGAMWLNQNTAEGSEIFILNYGIFPQLYFYNTNNNAFTLGLDPVFMKEYDENLYRLYEDAIFGRKDPYPIIKNNFNAEYIYTERIQRYRAFNEYLSSNTDKFKLVFSGKVCGIYEVA